MRRSLLALLALLLLAPGTVLTGSVAPTAAAPADGWQPRPERFPAVHVTEDVAVTMSDGVVLSVNVYRPARADGTPIPGRFPVVLTQTPYNKSTGAFRNDYLVQRGYVQVEADVRGTGSSGGSWASFDDREQRDSFELVRWAHSRNRPWSNGDVGLWGISYAAINQFFTAAQHPPGLKAMFPIVPAGDVYRDVVASGGQVDAGFIPLWLGLVTATGVVPPAYTAVEPDRALVNLMQHAGGALAFQAPTLAGAALGGDRAFDGPFYRTRSPLSVVDDVEVPAFVVAGHHDLFQRGAPMLFERLQRNGVPTRLLTGPWTHLEAAADPDLPDHLGSLDALAVRWFDRYLDGRPDPDLDVDIRPVTYYEIGSGLWRTAPRWIPPRTTVRTFHLGGTAGPGSPGTLTRRPTRAAGGDPVLPVPVAGLCTRSASQWTAGILSGSPCDSDSRLDDAVGTSYQTPPFTRAMRVQGPLNARLFASTTARDGMLSVHVEDVAPDGTVERLSGGWQVLSHRRLDPSKSRRLDGEVIAPWHPFTEQALLPVDPGEVMRVDVEVFPTGAVIRKGHRLRITIQAYDTPHLLPTARQLLDQASGVITLHHSPEHRSRLVVPVRP